MPVEQRSQERFRSAKAGTFELANCTGEINHAALGGKIEQAECTGNAKPLLSGGAYTRTIVDQQQVGMHGCRQRDSCGFALVNAR